ncbi:MAG: AAA family ATPase [Candidatus Cloacimonadaceae bacterium]
MSILSDRAKSVSQMPIDGIYVIYGNTGTGKTVLASTFPKTKEAPLLYLDILEGDTGSISSKEREHIQVVEINHFRELDEVLTDVENGFTVDGTGKKVPIKYSTIVFSTATQLEFMLKQYLMEANQKDTMNLNLWGQAKQGHDQLWNLCKYLHKKTGANIVVLAHQKEIQNEDNPQFNNIIPSLMNSAAYALCAKASFVWFTKVESDAKVDPQTQEVTHELKYITYIGAHPYLLTKTRKPQEMAIPQKISNLTFPKFKKNILDKLNQ